MRRITIIALVFLAIGSPESLMAQMMLGPKIGMNVAGQYQSDYTVPKYDVAYGAALQIHISEIFKVQGEFLVSNKGWRENLNGKNVFEEFTATYLEVPAMIKYTNMGVNWGFFGAGGGYWAYWNKAEGQGSIDGKKIDPYPYSINSDFGEDGYRDIRSDFGLLVEAGVTYDNLGSGILALGVRYSHGLIATGEDKTPTESNVEKKNRVLTISLTYFLYL